MTAAVPTVLKRALRIVALPLTAAPPLTLAHEHPVQLTYYHFLTPPLSAKQQQSLTRRAVAKASQLWAGLGKAEEGSWKRKAFLYGERLVNRLDFEELALKSVDPSLGPKIIPRRSSAAAALPKHLPVIPLIYPPSACSSPLPQLRALLEKRTPRHRKGFIVWLLIAPMTTPFMLVPVIPNFPFFFCVWRSWSHYRAYKASQYLGEFLDQGAIIPEPSTDLDAIYAQYSPEAIALKANPPPDVDADASASPTSVATPIPSERPPVDEPSHTSDTQCLDGARLRLLLTPAAVPPLAARLGLSTSATFASDMYRALEQAGLRCADVRQQ